MKSTTYRIIRAIGVLGAIWIVCLVVNAHIQIHQQTGDSVSASTRQSIILGYFNTATLPFASLAVLLVLPYARMRNWMKYGAAALVAILAAVLFNHLFGVYFLSARFLLSAIPAGVLFSATIVAGFFIVQIAAILFGADLKPKPQAVAS